MLLGYTVRSLQSTMKGHDWLIGLIDLIGNQFSLATAGFSSFPVVLQKAMNEGMWATGCGRQLD